ncbi:ATP-binding cassette domain-containing protein [Romboutsia weinsteinii]|uniref:ATP-binding cassette domain-containing protein n=1 Tax=Romboutsia weinsteinii TaxID=2020949 RepID=A0A255HIF4_9FIRM|nr:ATP-binding cassette domain-containing protein [Romboutsia weinsteinii]RDY26400.1 ATP-binding cassette domain-containing protein [Romboutsia weinsteinii]
MTVLRLIDVKYKYEGSNRYTLKDINIEFELGKVYSILGRSGSGKSTLLSILSGLDNCTTGSIFYKDEALSNINKDLYRTNNLGIVFKENNLINNASSLDNIILAMGEFSRENKHKKEIIYDLLRSFDIDEVKIKTKVDKLSDYEKKKISIARSLINNPEIIIVDEPIEGLDEEEVKYIMEKLSDLARSNNKCVIIFSSSDKITSYSDEIWGMVNGKVIFVKEAND